MIHSGSMPHLAVNKRRLIALITAPAVVIFVSSNLVNVGNLAFNMVFSRWMGPDLFGDLALLLTIKLALLGILGAVQMATSQLVATEAEASKGTVAPALARIQRLLFVTLWLALPAIGMALWQSELSERLGLSSPILLLILLASIPFWAPLCILRGVAFGTLATGRVVASANAEMLVRLVGAIAAWQAGFGIEGVVVAIALSIVAGWVVLARMLPAAASLQPIEHLAATLCLATVPFAALQIAQVLTLDGELVIVKLTLTSREAGFIAALSLFQRIQFFACFALASILLPGVVRAVRSGGSILNALVPIGLLYAAVTLALLACVKLAPTAVVTLLVGPDFSDAVQGLRPAAFAVSAFTLSYLLATLLAAIGDRNGIWATLTMALIQLCAVAFTATRPEADFVDLMTVKAACQVALCLFLILLSAFRLQVHLTCTRLLFPKGT